MSAPNLSSSVRKSTAGSLRPANHDSTDWFGAVTVTNTKSLAVSNRSTPSGSSPNTIRSFTGSADAGVRAYGVGSTSPVRWFSLLDTMPEGSNDATPIAASVSRPMAARTQAHHRLRGAVSTMSVVVSVTDLTTQAAWMVGLAMLALVLAGWRKTARPTPRTPRRDPMLRRSWEPIGVAETTTSLYKRPSLLRRLWALVAGSGIAIVIGAVFAIVIAFGSAFLVITLTDLLKQ